jgi:hypothetical protein
VEIGSEKSKNKRKIGGSRARALAYRGRAADKIYRTTRCRCWASWAGIGPVGSDFFLFLFFYFFHNFCILAPNELKLISKFF